MPKIVTSAALALAATAVFSVVIPGSASAINQVPCNQNDFAKLFLRGATDRCFANDGTYKPTNRTVVHKICTGNNWLTFVGDLDNMTGMEARTMRPWTCWDMSTAGFDGRGMILYHFTLYR